MTGRKRHEAKPLSLMYWPLQHHLPLEGAPPLAERWISQEYTWGSHPSEGFMVSHDKPEDHDGVQTMVFSRLWVETGTATWGTTGTTSTVEQLVIEDLETAAFRPEDYRYPPRHEQAIEAEMFGRLGVPRLGALGVWKQAYQIREGDIVLASKDHEYAEPRTVTAVTADHSNGSWGPRVRLAWTGYPDAYMNELSWVALAEPPQ